MKIYTLFFFIFKKKTNPENIHILEHIICNYFYIKKNIRDTYGRAIKNSFYVLVKGNHKDKLELILEKIKHPSEEEYAVAKKEIILEKQLRSNKENDIELFVWGKRTYLENQNYRLFLKEMESSLLGYALKAGNVSITKNFDLKDILVYSSQQIKKTEEVNTIILDYGTANPMKNIINSYLDFDFLLKTYAQKITVSYDYIGGTYYIQTKENPYKVIKKIKDSIKKIDKEELYMRSKLQFFAENLSNKTYLALSKYICQLYGVSYKINFKSFCDGLNDLFENGFNQVIIK